ncbi:MAG: hypothetical protein AB9888_03395 [Bacteroidales bacterium]
MKKLLVLAVLAVAFGLFTGCATVKVYSDAGLTTETGLRYYTLKPYILVEYMANKDNTVKTSVVFLPDLLYPQYIKVKPGIGSSELKMTFSNSSLESYGVATDSQIPESMAAFADILSKSAYAAQNFSGSRPDMDTAQEYAIPFRLYEIVFRESGVALREVKL